MGRKSWRALFEPSPFFSAYKKYFQIELKAATAHDLKLWKGWIESRLRELTAKIELNTKLKLLAHLYPRDFWHPSDTEGTTHRCCFYVGLRRNKRLAMQAGHEFDFTQLIMEFRHSEILRYNQLKPGMQIYITYIKASALPNFVLQKDNGKRKRSTDPQPSDDDATNEVDTRAE